MADAAALQTALAESDTKSNQPLAGAVEPCPLQTHGTWKVESHSSNAVEDESADDANESEPEQPFKPGTPPSEWKLVDGSGSIENAKEDESEE